MRKMFICGNWKMQKSKVEMLNFFKDLSTKKIGAMVDYAIAPVSLHLESACAQTADDSVIVVAQNMHYAQNGAFTGEITAGQLKDISCSTVILGHSERRAYYCETSESVALKVETALTNGMVPIVCIGETLEQRENKQTFSILEEQLKPVLEKIEQGQAENVIIAYEPVWAIGTGKTASSAIAQEVHVFIRQLLHQSFGETSDKMRLLYGGSVKPNNVKELLSQPDIDGALVGGASLDVESFTQLLEIAETIAA